MKEKIMNVERGKIVNIYIICTDKRVYSKPGIPHLRIYFSDVGRDVTYFSMYKLYTRCRNIGGETRKKECY